MKEKIDFKKITSFLLAVLIFISAFFLLSFFDKSDEVRATVTKQNPEVDEELLTADDLFDFELGQDGYYVTNYKGNQKHLDIPQYYNGEKVVGIKDVQPTDTKGVFEGMDFYSVNMGENCVKIGKRAFYDCENIEKVYFSKQTTYIGRNAFYNCISLYDLDIPSTVTYVGFLAFYNTGWYLNALEDLNKNAKLDETVCLYYDDILLDVLYVLDGAIDNIKDGTRVIAEWAFGRISSKKFTVTKIVIPSTVKYINGYNLGVDGYNSQTNVKTLIFNGNSNEITFGERSFYENGSDLGVSSSTGDVKFGFKKGIHFVGEQVTYYSSEMPENVVLDDSFKVIAEGAFKNCSKLVSIVIPEGVKYIGKNAFINCVNLKTVIYRGTGLIIDENAFKNCEKLENFEGIENVKEINADGFENCNNLQSVTLNNCSIGVEAFKNCSLVIVSIIGNCTFKRDVFYGCDNVKESIDDYYFGFKPNQTELVVVNSDKVYVCDGAFKNSKITKIEITASEIHLGKNAFENCKELESVTLSCSVELSDFCFNGDEKLTTLNFSPSSIGKFALSGTSVTQINSTETKRLEKYALSGSKISEIDLSNVEENGISYGAFYSAENLNNINGNSEYYAFISGVLYSKDEETLICYPTLKSDYVSLLNVKTIADYAFANVNLGDKDLVINASLIGKNAFYGFKAKSVTVNSNNLTIEEKAFYKSIINTFSFENEELNETGKTEYKSFAYSSIEKANFAETQLGYASLKSCSQLKDLTFAFNSNFSNVGYLFGGDYFDSALKASQYSTEVAKKDYYVSQISRITILGDSLPYGAFMNVQSLEGVVLGDSVKKISKMAFASCKNLKQVDIQNSVTAIKEQAFNGCESLDSVVLPANVSLEKGAFAYCKNLQSVELKGDAYFQNGVFSVCPNLNTVILSKTLTSSYNGYGNLFANAQTVKLNGQDLSREQINELKSLKTEENEDKMTVKEIVCLVAIVVGVIVIITAIIISVISKKGKHSHYSHSGRVKIKRKTK